jgi:hypothetical protein
MMPWAHPRHPGNRIRPNVKCIGCGSLGCVTAWGPWCFKCNVERMTRLSASFDQLAKEIEKLEAENVRK